MAMRSKSSIFIRHFPQYLPYDEPKSHWTQDDLSNGLDTVVGRTFSAAIAAMKGE